jgi:N-acetylmuramoyl-L-alanine amidase
LTNPSEEKQLKNKEYLAKIADGICSAIETFFEQYPEKIVHAF